MKKRLWTVLLSFSLALAMLPVASFAESSSELKNTGVHILTYVDYDHPEAPFYQTTALVTLPDVSEVAESTPENRTRPYVMFGASQDVAPWNGLDAGLVYFTEKGTGNGQWKVFMNGNSMGWVENSDAKGLFTDAHQKVFLQMYIGDDNDTTILARNTDDWTIIDQITRYTGGDFNDATNRVFLTRETALAQDQREINGSVMLGTEWEQVMLYSRSLSTPAEEEYIRQDVSDREPDRFNYEDETPGYVYGDTESDGAFIVLTRAWNYVSERVDIVLSPLKEKLNEVLGKRDQEQAQKAAEKEARKQAAQEKSAADAVLAGEEEDAEGGDLTEAEYIRLLGRDAVSDADFASWSIHEEVKILLENGFRREDIQTLGWRDVPVVAGLLRNSEDMTAEERAALKNGWLNSRPTERTYPASDLPFTDVSAEYPYANSICRMYKNGILRGTSATTFSPGSDVTGKAMLVALWRVHSSPSAGEDGTVSYMGTDSIYTTAYNWAVRGNLIARDGDPAFEESGAISRERAAVLMYREAARRGYDVSARADLTGYTDFADMDTGSFDAVSWAVAKGLLPDTDGSTIRPADTLTRGELAAMLRNFLTRGYWRRSA